MGIGTPGGVRILKMLAPIIVDDLYFGKDLQSSINKSRVIFYEPGVLMLEDGRSEEYIIDVSNCGYPYVDEKTNFTLELYRLAEFRTENISELVTIEDLVKYL